VLTLDFKIIRRVGIWQVVLRNFSIKFFLIFDFYRLNFSFSLIHFFLITCLCKIYRFIATINHSVVVIYYLRIKRVKKETLSVVTLLQYEVLMLLCVFKKNRVHLDIICTCNFVVLAFIV
jgi:uncharacterized RDD family membrane protein YckC